MERESVEFEEYNHKKKRLNIFHNVNKLGGHDVKLLLACSIQSQQEF